MTIVEQGPASNTGKTTSAHPSLQYDATGKVMKPKYTALAGEHLKALKLNIIAGTPFYNPPKEGKEHGTIAFVYVAEDIERPFGLDVGEARLQVTMWASAKVCPEDMVKLAMENSKARDAYRAAQAAARDGREGLAADQLLALRRAAADIPAVAKTLPKGVQKMTLEECKAFDAKHKAA